MLRSEPIVGYVRMHKCKMGVPRRVRLGNESQRMVARETEVVRGACIDEGEPAGGIRVPGVGRDLVERGLQLRGVNHERQIYGARQSLGNCPGLRDSCCDVNRARADWASARRSS